MRFNWKKILLSHGLEAGRDYTVEAVGGTPQRLEAMLANKAYAASMLNAPYSILAKRSGLKSLGFARELLGAYQGMSAFSLRTWASSNRQALVGYLAGYLDGLRWFLDPDHKRAAIALLSTSLKIPEDVATETYDRAVALPGGLAREARFDEKGLQNVLALRALLERPAKSGASGLTRFYDHSYYDAARAMRRRSPQRGDVCRRSADERC